jgi:tRNA threonylcarbamoyladenosine biosynthesis protein TsaB
VNQSTEAAALLGLDTSTADAVVATTRGGQVLDERRAAPEPDGRPRHAAVLLGEIELAVAAAGGWEKIGAIAVGVGPGTFTGLRIGISTARALAQARGLPVAAVSSLAALARGIGKRDPSRPRLAAIDARRGEIFVAVYEAGGAVVREPFVASPEAVGERLAALSTAPLAAGDGSLRFRDQLEAAGVEVLPAADPAHLMAARQICALAGEVQPGRPEQLKPAYLRRPDAEIWRERRERDQGSGRGG